MKPHYRLIVVVALLIAAALYAHAQARRPMVASGKNLLNPIDGNRPTRLLQHPTLSASRIAFVYAGDLWIVSREGGMATRLTSGAGVESQPAFSPDGKEIAFTGASDGSTDVYLIPSSGGVSRRLTYHPALDQVIGWTPDGKQILFASSRNTPVIRHAVINRLFTISREGGFPEELPLPMAAEGSFSPDGGQLAYVPLEHAFEIWKRYRGGRTSPVWIANLSDSSVVKVPRDNSNDFNPIWIDRRIFFLSDRNGPVSLFSYEIDSSTVTEVLPNNGFDFKYASKGPGGIVIEQFGAILLFDLKSGKAHEISIRVNGDMPEVRPQSLNVASRIRNADLSPTGLRAVFEARGEILTVPVESGNIRNLTNTPAVNERMPSWSPDGSKIAYFSDESGEYALHIKDQSGMGDVRKIDLGSPGSFFYFPTWSPDGEKIAYTDKRLNLWYVDIEKKVPVRVFHDRFTGPQQIFRAAWSPDSKWLAYTQQELSHMRSVFLYSLESGQSHRVTDGMSDSFSPVFDLRGKYLYLLASTNVGPSLDNSMSSFDHPVTSSPYICLLGKNVPSPLAVEVNKEREILQAAKFETSRFVSPEGAGSRSDQSIPVVEIDLDRMSKRILALPLPPRRYTELFPGKEGVLFLGEGLAVSRFDLKTLKTDKLVENIQAFHVSANGEKMLYRIASAPAVSGWVIAQVPPSASSSGAPPAAKPLNLAAMEVRVDPRAEWRQIYHEAFRLARDFFYDPGFHGLDLAATEKKYEPLLASVTSRQDLNYLFKEAFGEFTVGHIFIEDHERPEVNQVPVGLLGADYKVENGRYRFARIYDGENWNPLLRAPLRQPGINVTEGDYLLAVNGREIRDTENVYSFFQGTANKSVVLKVGSDPGGADAREVTVVPIANEGELRNAAWIESNRRKVDELSDGRLAYIYLPDTETSGFTYFNRYFFSQAGKEGAVIDERFNRGGTSPDYIIAYLQRTLMNYRTTRDGEDTTTPVGLIQGPKALIVNEYAQSGGDAMAFHFRQAKIGMLVGKRTWGGVTGLFGPAETLMDGWVVTAPSRGLWTPNDAWELENYGVAPDIEVEYDPKAARDGHDPQLEKAVQVLLESLAKNPIPTHKKPAYPKYQRPN